MPRMTDLGNFWYSQPISTSNIFNKIYNLFKLFLFSEVVRYALEMSLLNTDPDKFLTYHNTYSRNIFR